MIGTGTIPPPAQIRDCKFLSMQEFNELARRDWGWPTGKRIGRRWLQRMYNTYMLCEWVEIEGMVHLEVTHAAILEWHK